MRYLPEAAYNWNRNTVYTYLGFENTLWQDDFTDAEYVHNGVSDLETYRKLISIYEDREPGEKLFLFDLTMQNHGGYTESTITPYISTTNVQNTVESDIFLSIMDISDQALEYLINYFEKESEPVIICLFGDHQPKFSDESFYSSVYSQTEGLSDSDILMNQYKTPFLIWANYDIEEQDGMDISMNYLGALLAETSPFTDYRFLQYNYLYD